MSERATIQEQAQLGVESIPGTPVAATRKLLSVKFNPKVEMVKSPFTPSGSKFPTVMQSEREYASVPYTGVPSFNELPYLFSSLLGVATVTALTGGAHQWVWDVSSTDEAPTTTFTLETGQAIKSSQLAYLFINSMKMGFSNNGKNTLSGSAMAQKMVDHTLTASGVAEDDAVLVQGGSVCVFLDDTFGNLGTTKLTRAFNLDVDFPVNKKEIWTLDCDAASFQSLVGVAGGEPMVNLSVEADQADDLLDTARADATKFMRVHSKGPVISGSLTHELEMDFALKVESLDSLSDADGVYAQPYKLRAFHDAGWGKAHQVRIVTDLASL